MPDPIRLGLIGDNIGASQAPRFHVLAGRQNGVSVTYDRLVPRETGEEFEALFARVARGGYRGINVTYPYKERAARLVRIDDPQVAAMGAVNTVLFTAEGAQGYNTDHSGFIAAYRQARGEATPGHVLLIGAGGVGRSIAFALATLGAQEFRITDTLPDRADALADTLRRNFPGLALRTGRDAAALAEGATGMVNATPVGMVGQPGTPLSPEAMQGAAWAFDAVYTPVETQFLVAAQAAGAQTISGYELFIGQGVDAWRLFTGLPLGESRLRTELTAEVVP
ncbi:shikimate dehydrogenase [Pararhodobacter sp. SW119]|uniref:shikimate dehydrogenase family protein n=1 Tax=Pararhodobacter sp. SW119 TaxID=2780075 RepID=UPI001AE0125E|nr:shikimate dehydrogenase [Pararhodobacter sp. SW119]